MESLVSSNSTTDPTTTISGFLRFRDSNGVTHAMRDVYVEIWSNGIGCAFQPCADGGIGPTSTDDTGFFSLTFHWGCGIGCQSPRIWPVAFSKGHGSNPDVADVFCDILDCVIPQVGPGLEVLRTYHWEFPSIPFDTSGADINYGPGTLTPADDATKAQAFFVYDTILTEWLFIRDQTSAGGNEWDVPPIGVAFPCDGGISMCPGATFFDPYASHDIYIKADSPPGTILHEYSHSVMYQAYGTSWPVAPDVQLGTFDLGLLAACVAALAVVPIGLALGSLICVAISGGGGNLARTPCMLHLRPLPISCAWSEGWADFVPSEVLGLGNGVDWCPSLNTPSPPAGECGVASALWIATHPDQTAPGASGAIPFWQIIATLRDGVPGSCSLWANPPVGQQCVSTQTDFRDYYNDLFGCQPTFSCQAAGFDPTWLNLGAFKNGLFTAMVSGACGDGTSVVPDVTGALTFTVKVCPTGPTVGQVILPPSTIIPADTLTFTFSDNGVDASLQASGPTVPTPPGKTLSVRSDGQNGVCIIDNNVLQATSPLPTCDTTNTANSQVLMPCDGISRTFTGFPVAPTTRTYGCQLQHNGLITVTGLANSFIESISHGMSSTEVSCSPSTVPVNVAATCTATVTDTTVGAVSTPTGTATLTTDSAGVFSSNTCTLGAVSTGVASCHVMYTPSSGSEGTHHIGASYGGDANHFLSSSNPFSLNVVAFDFSIQAGPSDVTVLAGQVAPYSVSTTLLLGTAPPVSLSVISGLPAGATANFVPGSVTPSATSKLLVTTTSGMGLGDYTLTIQALGGGLTRTTTVALHVYDFSISVSPSDATVLRGGSNPYTITLTLAPGSSTPPPISLGATGLPAGSTAGFSSAFVQPTLAGATATLDVKTYTGAPGPTAIGDFTISVTGLDAVNIGGGSRSTSPNLHVYDFTVTAAPASLQVLTAGSNTYSVTVALVPGSSTTRLPTIALTVGGLPSGATGVFSPGSGTPVLTSTLTITTSNSPSASYALTITATDTRSPQGGARMASPTLVVLTAVQALPQTIDQINSFKSSGVLNGGQANALTVKLSNAIDELNLGNPTTACNELNAFVNQVNTFVSSGILTPAQASLLLGGPLGVVAIMASVPC